MDHVVELAIKRFYRCYVPDEAGTMTEDEIIEAAKRMALEDRANIDEDMEMSDIEPDDILGADHEYDVD